MAPLKETFMVLTVDLECNRCYTKVKRTLCSFPQVQDQIYKEKENKVLIKVVCCSPEKIMDKIFAKGGKSIKGIEILKPKPPADKPADKPKDAPPAADKPKQGPPADKPKQGPPADNKPKDAPAAAAKPAQADDKPPKKNVTFKPDGQPAKPQADGAGKPQGDGGAKPKEGPPPAAAPKPAEQQAAMMAPMVPASVYGYGYPVNVGCLDCYEGRMCGYHSNGSGYGYGYGYGVPPPPPPAGGYGYGYGSYGVPPPPPPAYGYKPGYCVSRYGDYVSDENASGCVVM